jgi:hypothetical protein
MRTDSASVSAAKANITIEVLLVGSPRNGMRQCEPRRVNANPT